MALAAALLVLVLTAPAAYAVQYTVGDIIGWTQGVDYTIWTMGKKFTVGDTLLFNYDSSTHQVDVVTQSDYDSCSSSNALQNYNDGNTVITLSNAGTMYFICPTGAHCAGGMKLSVNVLAASGGTPSIPSIPGITPNGSTSLPPLPTIPSTPGTTPNGSTSLPPLPTIPSTPGTTPNGSTSLPPLPTIPLTPGTTPSGSNSSPPPPPPSGSGATTIVNYNGLMLSFSVGLGIALAVMN